jgi:hypothetical protein
MSLFWASVSLSAKWGSTFQGLETAYLKCFAHSVHFWVSYPCDLFGRLGTEAVLLRVVRGETDLGMYLLFLASMPPFVLSRASEKN